MNLQHHSTVSRLVPRELSSITITCATRFHCLEGSVWITQHLEVEDLIVEQGACVVLVKNGDAILQALGAAAAYSVESL